MALLLVPLLLELHPLLVPVVLLLLLEVPPQVLVEQLHRVLVPWAAGEEPPVFIRGHVETGWLSGNDCALSAHPNQTVCNVRYLLDVCLFVSPSSLLC